MLEYCSVSTDINIIVTHPSSTFTRTFHILACYRKNDITFFCSLRFCSYGFGYLSQMSLDKTTKLHMNLTIVNTRDTIHNKIRLQETSTSLQFSYLVEPFNTPAFIISDRVAEHIIEDSLSQVVKFFQLLFLGLNDATQFV